LQGLGLLLTNLVSTLPSWSDWVCSLCCHLSLSLTWTVSTKVYCLLWFMHDCVASKWISLCWWSIYSPINLCSEGPYTTVFLLFGFALVCGFVGWCLWYMCLCYLIFTTIVVFNLFVYLFGRLCGLIYVPRYVLSLFSFNIGYCGLFPLHLFKIKYNILQLYSLIIIIFTTHK
jgi:hypothetical protein